MPLSLILLQPLKSRVSSFKLALFPSKEPTNSFKPWLVIFALSSIIIFAFKIILPSNGEVERFKIGEVFIVKEDT